MEEQAFRRLPPRLSHALVHKFPSMLEYKSPTSLDMPEIFTDLDRASGSGRARSAPRKSGRGRCCRSCRRWPTRSTTRSACASTRCRSRRRRSCRRCRRRRAGKPARSGPAAFPDIAWPEPLLVAPPWEGGDGRASNEPERSQAQGRRRRRSDGGSALMMRLPPFRYRAPRTVDEAAAWLAESPADTMLLAGGTDLLPNMKRRQQTPATLIGLRGVRELARRSRNGDGLTIGAGVTLSSADRATRGSAQPYPACGRRPRRSRRRTCATWARSAATSASTRAAPTTTRTTSGARRSTSA